MSGGFTVFCFLAIKQKLVIAMSANDVTKAKALITAMGHDGRPSADRQGQQDVALLTPEEEQYYIDCIHEAWRIAHRANEPYDPSVEIAAVILDKIAANLYWIRSGEVDLARMEEEPKAPEEEPEPEPEQEQQEEDPVEREREEMLDAGWNESRSRDVLWINDQKVHRRIFRNVRTGNIWERDIECPSPSSSPEVEK